MRVTARLDVKNEFVIKGIHLEGLRKVGDPNHLALKYYEQGADEIIFMDAVASLYERNNLFHILERACEDVFIPITIGGGIRTIEDIQSALRAGADKVAINTAAINNPDLISEASRIFGSQSIVGSIEAKRKGEAWEAYIDNGRDRTGVDALQWAAKLESLGVGEIFLTSVDQEGTKRGFDIDLIEQIMERVSIPVIISGGMGALEHIEELFQKVRPNAIALASAIHYGMHTFSEVKDFIKGCGAEVRV